MAKQQGKQKQKKKRAKHLLSGPEAVAMKAASEKPAKGNNPFETIWSRRKFDIVGKKRRGEERRVGLARSQAIEKRKKTLLKEYERSGKSSVFMDNRIGEQDEALGEFDKAILRFQHERQLKLKRKSKYNLSDGEEEDSENFQGASLSRRDDFDEEILPEDDDNSVFAEIGEDTAVRRGSHDHGMYNPSKNLLQDEDENNHKTKKQVMEEIISKSKFYKAQKAKDKEEDESLMEKLDNDFTSLAQSEALLHLTQPNKMNALKSLLKNNIKKPVKEGVPVPAGENREAALKEQPDAYDRLVREMVMDMRARPSDRLKTVEEIAQEERERLELLEEERKKRMLASDESGDESDDEKDDGGEDLDRPEKLRSLSGDDLGDSFSSEKTLANKKGWVDEIIEREDMDHTEDEEDGSSEGSQSEDDQRDDDDDDEDSDSTGSDSDDENRDLLSVKNWEQSDDDDLSSDEEEEAKDERGMKKVEDNGSSKKDKQEVLPGSKKSSESAKPPSAKQETLPFVIEAPTSLTELSSLLDNRSNNEIVEAINRIRACSAIKLASENRRKMQVFYGVLLQYFAVLANKKPLNFTLINLMVKPLLEMSVETPYFAAICARQRLMHTRTQFVEQIKNSEISSWPSVKTLLLLKLWSMIFPCSDFRHVVMTPATLLMCEYLMRCPIMTGQDVAVGSFLCSMMLLITKHSRKFYPEVMTFLWTLLISATERETVLHQQHQVDNLMELKLKPWLCLHSPVSEVSPLDFIKIMELPADSPVFGSDAFKASVLFSVIQTIRGYVNLYEEFSSFPEIFSPVSSLLQEVQKQDNLPNSLLETIDDDVQLIKKKVYEHHTSREPLQMRKQKPVPIRLLNPKFEEDFVKGRDYDPDRERVERRKLNKLLKREAKGAARELRKDNHFLFGVKEREQKLLEEERTEKYGKALAFLQEQEHAFKSGQLGKGGRKRRR
ncbi:hypothetical protein QJS04_geneDACA005298 [Acorus gramineus]|uniref:Nucleolar protein 14 n=1 Tax=Acorus gramineus TaxID=55184 RepID=A0AAV9AWL3_ACOGR|nr:hypothetical protein QJS04_geneDACA005298 [Acorus gramineus]